MHIQTEESVVFACHVDLRSCTAGFDREVAGYADRRICQPGYGHPIWLFAGSKVGGERAAAIYTVIETCKLNGIEPQAYIADVIARIAGDWPASRWDELMPWNWRSDPPRIGEAA